MLVLVALALSLVSVACDAVSGATEVKSDSFPVGASPALNAAVGNGKLDIQAGAANVIEVTATLEGAEDITYEAFMENGTVTVRAETTGNARANVVILAPSNTVLEAVTGNGAIDIVGISGVSKVVSGNGRVDVAGAASDLKVTTGNGAISVTGAVGRFDLLTGNGAITLQASGEIDLLSGNGSIKFEGELVASGQNKAVSGNGSIDLALLGTPNVTLDLEARSGNITNRLGGTVTFSSEKEYRGVVGDGSANLEASTGNGSITVR